MSCLSPARLSAGGAVLLALIYLVAGLATGHSASAIPPTDLSAKAEGVDVYQALALLASKPGQVAILDVRSADSFALYHLPGARSVPGGGVADLQAAAKQAQHLLVVAAQEDHAVQLTGKLRAKRLEAHYLAGGAQAWYLALELPIPLFASQPPPFGFQEALDQVRSWLASSQGLTAPPAVLHRAIERLAAANYGPSQLKASGPPKASGKKKPISGGCS
jgi:rhodanese-related sulfurtransferase